MLAAANIGESIETYSSTRPPGRAFRVPGPFAGGAVWVWAEAVKTCRPQKCNRQPKNTPAKTTLLLLASLSLHFRISSQ